MIKNVLEYLEQSAAKSPDKTAVADEHNAFTYQELLDNAQRSGCGTAKGNTGAYRSSGLYGKEL